MRSFALALALALTLTLVLAAPALAQGPSQDGYTPDGPKALEQTRSDGDDPGGDDDPGGGDDSGALPFTGMDLLLVAGLGAGLLGVGAGMRRLTRPADHASS